MAQSISNSFSKKNLVKELILSTERIFIRTGLKGGKIQKKKLFIIMPTLISQRDALYGCISNIIVNVQLIIQIVHTT